MGTNLLMTFRELWYSTVELFNELLCKVIGHPWAYMCGRRWCSRCLVIHPEDWENL